MDAADEQIRTIEIAATRAWPATEAEGRDGWLRHTPAVPRSRNNPALPPLVPGASADIAAVEAWYARRGGPAQIQVTRLAWHDDLDATLAARGWTIAHGADVLAGTTAAVLGAGPPPDGGVVLADRPDARWLAAWATCEGRDPASLCRARARDLRRGRAARHLRDRRRRNRRRRADPRPGHRRVFCMATHPDHRRRGAAGRVLRALAADAAARGSDTLYLQVDSRNTIAGALYARHGFTRSHGYRFRVAP